MAYDYTIAKLIDHEVKGTKKSFDLGFNNAFAEYQKDNRLCEMYNTLEFSEIFTSTESIDGFRKVGHQENPPIMNLDDGYSTTISEDRYAGKIIVSTTEQRKMKDNTVLVREFLTRQRNRALDLAMYELTVSANSILNDGFTGTTFVGPDSEALFSNSHTWNSTGNTLDNLLTGTDLETLAEEIEEYGANFVDAKGKISPKTFDTIIVKKGSDAHRKAVQLYAKDITPTQINDINVYQGTMTIIASPFITTATNVAYKASRGNIGGENSIKLGMGAKPTWQAQQISDNGDIFYRIESWWKLGIFQLPQEWAGAQLV